MIGLFILSQEHRLNTSLPNSVSPSFCNALKPQNGQNWTVETWEQAKERLGFQCNAAVTYTELAPPSSLTRTEYRIFPKCAVPSQILIQSRV